MKRRIKALPEGGEAGFFAGMSLPYAQGVGGARPRVTILCGFLGAGKTTLLRHVLAQAAGRTWAVVVNDVAAINIDGALVKSDGVAIKDVVELEGGCVCCSSRDELAEAIAELAASGKFEHILVETTGVAVPQGVARLFTQKNPFGRTLGEFAELGAMVSVIDVAYFLGEWRRYQQREVARELVVRTERPVFELMWEQVECADVLVLNKCDLATESEVGELEAILRGLNSRAEQVRTERGQIASEFLLGRVRFDAVETLGAARWIKVLNTLATGVPSVSGANAMGGAATGAEQAYGIRSFVYQQRRPFVREKLRAWLVGSGAGVLRAKGYVWVAEQPDEMGFISIAGGVVRLEFLSYWWAAMIESGRARRTDVPVVLEKIWEEPMGDRRQEIVCIGVGVDEAAWRAGLDSCLA